MKTLIIIVTLLSTITIAYGQSSKFYNVFTENSLHNIDSREGNRLVEAANYVLQSLSEQDRAGLIDKMYNNEDSQVSLIRCSSGRIYLIGGLEFEDCVGIQFDSSSRIVTLQGYSGFKGVLALGVGLTGTSTVESYGGELPEDSKGNVSLFVEGAVLLVGAAVETSSKFFHSAGGLAVNIGGIKIGRSEKAGAYYQVEIKEDFYTGLFSK